MRVLEERYFLKDKNGKPIETVEEMCWRVAWEMARAEVKYGKGRNEVIAQARIFYDLMLKRWFLPNSPTLMNAGKNNNLQYSACYVIPVEDSLVGIFDGVKYQSIVHQSGGGTGFSFSRLRPKGSRVKSSMGVASGPVSFMRVYNEATQTIKQGGTRRGANMGILRIDHPDILEFIHCKEDGGITNFNISCAVTDKFMDALAKDREYDLIDPHSGKPVGKLSARKVWDEIAKGAWATGDPGLIFLDRINSSTANPIRADGWLVESTNPCGEQPLYPFDACNLGSIFLGYFVKNESIDWDKLRDVVHTAVKMLDSVIEMNPFPLPQISDTVRKIRRIGLGVGGWADMLAQMGIPYDSNEAVNLAEKLMKFINDEGHYASQQLAKERGPFPLWKQSIYKDNKPIRNSTVTTIAPTGTIGILAAASGGIEPFFAIAYQHIVKSEGRTLNFVNPIFEEMAKKRNFYSEKLMEKVAERGTVRGIEELPEDVKRSFGTAHEIHPDWHVKMQAAFQKYTDNAVSKTINLSHEATVDDIKRAYMLAWESDCRGITVFRDGCKGDQVLNLGVKKDDKSQAQPTPEGRLVQEVQAIKPRPVKVEGATYKIETPVGNAFITVNHDADGNPFEVFVTIGKAGSEVAALAEALGRLISTTLRFGNHLPAKERAREIMLQMQGIGGGRSVGFGINKVRSLPDAVAKAIGMHFGLIGYRSEISNIKTQMSGMQTVSEVQNQQQLTIDNQAFNGNGESNKMFLQAAHRDLCPSCGEASLVLEEGCKKCYSCGYSEC
ncbi:ribonucleoside-diphosphate reductase, adenosylcobalamin-dependent [Candidatus Woesebacteria bacterium RIFCSPHIGHO2_02_FULL_38_9]|uniref:Vitamin B12-dependent ribonucleotide reductase n=1 Tax=Candidatus Woesebacteria bacterium RIFCSPHIGHO2_01_FULL_39_28 TaxID=1802496 RepID=A0A1F7Y8W6_9BACT|nr:MAG: ribonucleoside-diphosphate reductase, adenosylcobalamin-dependent [Candidatus Woesebacteria bacterium RIFCSPHIGHO2_01_FULL_39_28]OGM33747.1 MAG: ribonucleoside-diphosphate reductase, adenosylcobalamin-dependent [Candidatus Woesebacteria bacterium RIFCSPHIGHO2_02_FULL_38_9]OGM57273.1 MAG: ribonucleoside-diphosphate reductase, adenosylcobalamin-dependent [Candidatus Woesebacteria bacterium RIFCSPLOWO2_01_FULL_38_20]